MRVNNKGTIVEGKSVLAAVSGKIAEVKGVLAVVGGKIVEAWKAIAGYNLTGFTISCMDSSKGRGFWYRDEVNSKSAEQPKQSGIDNNGTQNVKIVSPSGRYVMTSSSDSSDMDVTEVYNIYCYDGYIPTWIQSINKTNSFTAPMSVNYLYGWKAVRFSPDDSRIAFLCTWQEGVTTDKQTGIVFFKKGSAGLYVYEKKVCLCSSAYNSGYTHALDCMMICDDLSTVIGVVSGTNTAKIYKGSPEVGYSEIFSSSITNASYNTSFDEEKGEYVKFQTSFYYINGNTVTKLTAPSSNNFKSSTGSRLVFNGDRTNMYTSYYYGGTDFIYSYSISNKTTITYLTRYYKTTEANGTHIICDHAGLSNKALLCFWDGVEGEEDYEAYCAELTKSAAGGITGATWLYYYSRYPYNGSYLYKEATRFINRAEQ